MEDRRAAIILRYVHQNYIDGFPLEAGDCLMAIARNVRF